MFKDKVKSKQFWSMVRESDDYSWQREELMKQYAQFASSPDIPSLKYSDFKLYYTTGNRSIYEDKYFARRQRLNSSAILSLIYPEKEEYAVCLQDTINAICDEYTWVLPAHHKTFPATQYSNIDLFSAETGFALSEIKFVLGDALEPFIAQRIDDEIERRIIRPFLDCPQSWESFTHNWSAVCAGSVAVTFLYQHPELYDTIEPRISGALSAFFSSYFDDGACREGLSYWEYGFGFFAYYAQLLCEITEGRKNLFDDAKVKTIASFPQKAYLTDKITLSFADGSSQSKMSLGLIHMIKTIYPDDVELLPFECMRYDDHCARWCHQIRSFVFYNHDYTKQSFNNNVEYYLADSAWYVKKTPHYSVAVKAGDNDEPHNHNDIGSFIVAKDSSQLLCDLGAGEYTKKYFSDDRYDILCNSSFGHCVPIINGKGQSVGKEFFGIMNTPNENIVTVDMKSAYDEPTLKKLVRTFKMNDNSVLITDAFDFMSDGEYISRLVSLIEPHTENGVVKIGELTIAYDNNLWSLSVTQAIHTTHVAPVEVPVYLLDFSPSQELSQFNLKLKFDE